MADNFDALDVASRGYKPNQLGWRDGRVSWGDIQALKKNPKTSAAVKTALESISKDEFDALCNTEGTKPLIYLKDLVKDHHVKAPKHTPATDADVSAAAKKINAAIEKLSKEDRKQYTQITASELATLLGDKASEITPEIFDALRGDDHKISSKELQKWANKGSAAAAN